MLIENIEPQNNYFKLIRCNIFYLTVATDNIESDPDAVGYQIANLLKNISIYLRLGDTDLNSFCYGIREQSNLDWFTKKDYCGVFNVKHKLIMIINSILDNHKDFTYIHNMRYKHNENYADFHVVMVLKELIFDLKGLCDLIEKDFSQYLYLFIENREIS